MRTGRRLGRAPRHRQSTRASPHFHRGWQRGQGIIGGMPGGLRGKDPVSMRRDFSGGHWSDLLSSEREIWDLGQGATVRAGRAGDNGGQRIKVELALAPRPALALTLETLASYAGPRSVGTRGCQRGGGGLEVGGRKRLLSNSAMVGDRTKIGVLCDTGASTGEEGDGTLGSFLACLPTASTASCIASWILAACSVTKSSGAAEAEAETEEPEVEAEVAAAWFATKSTGLT